MKRMLLTAASCLMLLACKKSENKLKGEAQKAEKKYPISWSVSSFDQEMVKISGNKSTQAIGDTLKNYADQLYYMVYNSSGVLVSKKNYFFDDPRFGNFTDSLREGTYDVFIAASKRALLMPFSTESFNTAYFRSTDQNWNDTFAKTIKLTVTNTAVNQSIRLDRVVSLLEINLLDAMPANIKTIEIQCYGESLYLTLKNPELGGGGGSKATTGSPTSKYYTISASEAGTKNKKLTAYFGSAAISDIVLKAYDSSSRLIEEKLIPSVSFAKNKKTILTGTLFSNSPTTSAPFNITVSPIWAGTNQTVTF